VVISNFGLEEAQRQKKRSCTGLHCDVVAKEEEHANTVGKAYKKDSRCFTDAGGLVIKRAGEEAEGACKIFITASPGHYDKVACILKSEYITACSYFQKMQTYAQTRLPKGNGTRRIKQTTPQTKQN
jgi:hypothetical protein